MAGLWSSLFLPLGFRPYQARVPSGTAQRTDGTTHPVPSGVTSGYAYGTAIPLGAPRVGMRRWVAPYTVPWARTWAMQVPARAGVAGTVPNTSRAWYIPGTVGSVPGGPANTAGIDAVQSYLARLRR